MKQNGIQNVYNKFFINNQANLKQPNQKEAKNPNININIQINNNNSPLSNDFSGVNDIIPKLRQKELEFHPMISDKFNNNNNLKNASTIFPNQNSQFSNIELNKKVIMSSMNDQKTVFILQKILNESKSTEIKLIVKELIGEYRKLILDKYGNFFCKDLFKICDQNERVTILKELSPTISEDCCNNYATHPLQALIEYSSTEEEYGLILYSFNDYNKLLLATTDPNGSYVIQKIIMRIPERFRANFNFLFSSFIGFVCKKKYGIVAVKKFIEFTRGENTTQQIMNAIKLNFMNFAVDNYGNYLIQFILEKFANFPEGKEIKNLIFQNFNVMCKSKYSSFICELYVKMLTSEEKSELIKTLDINSIRNSNNPNAIKILKYLSININNNFPSQMQLPLSLNNNSQSNFMNY